MKNLKNCIIISLFASILLMATTFHLIDLQGSSKNSELEFGYLNSAGSWVLAPFAINPYGTRDYTWDEANATDWCSGAGTELDPWIIENITIDSGDSSDCLEIGQSDDYFIIRNCTFKNSDHYGLYMWSTSNGIVEDCTIFNNLAGVYISGTSQNNTIQHNYFYNNTGASFRLYGSSTCINNTISDNIFINRLTASLPTALNIQGYNNKLINNTVDNFMTGIYLDYAHDTIIKSNTFISSWRGISTGGYCFNATVFNNTIRDNHNDYGVYVNGNGSIFYRNTFINNNVNAKDSGQFNRWDNGVIGNYWDNYDGNDTDDNAIGDTPYILPDSGGSQDNYPIWDDGFNGTKIHIDDTGFNSFDWETASKLIWCTGSGTYGDPYTIENIAIDAGNVGSPIFIESSSVYFVIENCNLTNSQATGDDAGIKFEDVYNGKIVENNITENYVGVKLIRSDNNSISSNYIYDNAGQGIVLQQSEYNVIMGNTANNSNYYGLLIVSASHNNTIEENTFGNNKGANGYGSGIKISGSSDCEISENLLSDNDQGIRITDNSHSNKFYDNVIHNNAKYGVLIQDLTRNCNNSVFYNNSFINPLGMNAYDNGSNSEWDNGIHGNFWSDYGGADNNGDGIGDTPYLISGDANSQDFYPKWSEGDDTYPTISIIIPLGGTLFSSDAPTYNLNIFDLYLNKSWYTLNNSATKYFFTPSNGNNVVIIDETGWDTFSDGSMLMTFYVNDTGGNTASASNAIIKDTTNPTISINSPLGGSSFGTDAPTYNLNIFDIYLNKSWYTLNNSATRYFFTPTSGINVIAIDETVWDSFSDGFILMTFYVNDTGGNTASVSNAIIKDTTNPTISINSPLGGSSFGTDAPTYNLNIFDLYLNKSWYTLNNSATRYFFTPTSGINVIAIDETVWDSFSDGFILMTFYVNDSNGDSASVSNMIEKDITNPTITLISPLGGTVFGSDAPQFNLTIFDSNLQDAWYTIDMSVTPHSFSPGNGINIIPIDQSSWDSLPEGSITIDFFVNDTLGNTQTIQVTITKDLPTSDPEPAIPFGNYYTLFLGIGIATMVLVANKKRKK